MLAVAESSIFLRSEGGEEVSDNLLQLGVGRLADDALLADRRDEFLLARPVREKNSNYIETARVIAVGIVNCN